MVVALTNKVWENSECSAATGAIWCLRQRVPRTKGNMYRVESMGFPRCFHRAGEISFRMRDRLHNGYIGFGDFLDTGYRGYQWIDQSQEEEWPPRFRP